MNSLGTGGSMSKKWIALVVAVSINHAYDGGLYGELIQNRAFQDVQEEAKKNGGREGFLILFHVKDADNFDWWNVGGWGDTRSALEHTEDGSHTPLGESASATIETGKWYDIRIEVKGNDIKCYIDDKLIT